MGLALSAIMLEGDHVQQAPRVFTEFGYRVETAVTEQAANFQPTDQDLYEVQLRGNWTVFVNLEHDLSDDQPTCEEVSKEYGCRLFTMNYDDHGGYYDYRMFDRGEKVRWWCYTDNEIVQEGSPLAEEQGTEDMAPDRRVVGVMARLGVRLISGVLPEADRVNEPVRVFLCRSLDADPERVLSATARAASSRPWWRFW